MRKLTGLGVILWSATALAGDVATKSEKGEVNWSQKTVSASGSGTFSNTAGNAAQARMTAERAATMDAQRNLLEIIKGVQVSTGKSGSQSMSNNEIQAKVEGIVRGFEIVDKKYFNDGGVVITIRVPIDSVLVDALVPDAGSKPTSATDPAGITALIIDATGLGVEPALAPRVLDESGKELFSAAVVTKKDAGICAYAKSVDTAKKDKRVGSKPLVLKAQKRASGSKNDVILSTKDAAQLAQAGYLSEGKLVIVVD